MAHEVFISYSSEDTTAADAVRAALESRGIACWIAPRDVLPSRRWGAAISQAINDSLLMILVLSRNSNRSDHITNEVQAAAHARVAVLPLRIEDVQPSSDIDLFIRGRHWLDAIIPPLEDHLERVAATVARILLLLCPNCKDNVSERETVCPHCGHDLAGRSDATTAASEIDHATVEALVQTGEADRPLDEAPSSDTVSGAASNRPPAPPSQGASYTLRLPSLPPWGYWLGGGGAVLGVILLSFILLGGGNGDPPPPLTTPLDAGGPQPEERIFFSSPDANGVDQIFSVAVDGSDQIQLTTSEFSSVEPSAATDGTRLVFVRLNDAGERELYLLDLATGAEATIAAPPGDKAEPAFSPDGQRLAFSLRVGGHDAVYVMNLDGREARSLTGSDFDEKDPAWSPDGARIAFSSNREPDNHDIYAMQADGSGDPIRLTDTPGFDGEPDWSPDGTAIVFQSFRPTDDPSSEFNLWILDPAEGEAGETFRQVTSRPGNEFDPVWSPDGSSLAFTGQNGEAFDVYIVSAAGGQATRVTGGPAKSVRPSWCICLPQTAQ